MAYISKRLTRLHVKEGSFNGATSELFKEISWDEIRSMPDSFFVCRECHSPWFYVYKEEKNFVAACKKCSFCMTLAVGKSTSVESQGQIKCNSCPCKVFAIIKQADILCIGCKNCAFEVRVKIPEHRSESGLILLN